MHPYEEHVWQRLCEGLRGLDPKTAGKVYALSLYHTEATWSRDAEDNEVTYQECIRLGCATEPQYAWQLGQGRDEIEARWNYAYWPQEELVCIPEMAAYGTEPDQEEFALRADWCEARGLRPEGRDASGMAIYGVGLARETIRLCTRVAHRMHESGILREVFGRPIPVIIHDLAYSEEEVGATLMANPVELLEGFRQYLVQSYGLVRREP